MRISPIIITLPLFTEGLPPMAQTSRVIEDAEPARVLPSSLPVDVSSADVACPYPRVRMHQVRPGDLDTATSTLRAQLSPMQSPAVSRSRHLTVCDRVSVCGHASASGRHTSGLCIAYLFSKLGHVASSITVPRTENQMTTHTGTNCFYSILRQEFSMSSDRI